MGEPGPAGEQGPPGDNPRVIDGNGVDVGQLISIVLSEIPSVMTVFHDEIEAIIQIRPNNGERYGGIFSRTLYFTEPQCEGLAYYEPASSAGFLVSVTHQDVTRHFVGRPGPTQEITFESSSTGSSTGGCSPLESGSGYFLLTEEVTDRFDLTFPIPLPIAVVSGGN